MALVRDEKSIGIAIGHCALGSFHQEDAIIVTFRKRPGSLPALVPLNIWVTASCSPAASKT